MGAAPPITGVLETGVYVDDLAKARSFYEGVLGFAPMFADERLCAYPVGPAGVFLLFLRGATQETVTLPGGSIPPHDGSGPMHFAFAIAADSLAAWRARLAEAGVEIESEMVWPRGAVSLYFRDPDGHLVELATPGLWANY
ncbi:VOC family protein [Pseudoxanthobacter sp. M-2]|uniref:VOC family protein n=1 Tax=Pseudoxanthobacter sp. M-2 TaxID=3078754 RepID=UPI0038FCB51B